MLLVWLPLYTLACWVGGCRIDDANDDTAACLATLELDLDRIKAWRLDDDDAIGFGFPIHVVCPLSLSACSFCGPLPVGVLSGPRTTE